MKQFSNDTVSHQFNDEENIYIEIVTDAWRLHFIFFS